MEVSAKLFLSHFPAKETAHAESETEKKHPIEFIPLSFGKENSENCNSRRRRPRLRGSFVSISFLFAFRLSAQCTTVSAMRF